MPVPERILTMPASGDRFIITDRPTPTPTRRYRPLPHGMNSAHLIVVRAHQVRAGDIVTALFTNGPGTRRTRHLQDAFTAQPRAFDDGPADCGACEDTHTRGLTPDRYLRLAPADDYAHCTIVFRNAPVAIVPADTAAHFPSPESVPPLAGLFTLDDGEYEWGPYEALPVTRGWGPWDPITVTRATAEQITTDLGASHTGRNLTCRWAGDALLITSDPRLRTDPGRPGRLITPDPEGRYRIGGLCRWENWAPPECPECSADTEQIDADGETAWRCTVPDCG